MKINLAKSAGFCSGVKRAITMALETAGSREKVYMLGDIVHNEIVVEAVRRAGIKKIGRLSYGKGKTLLIRAHGSSRAVIEKALARGYRIIDATCPMVKEIHKIACEMEKKGYRIIIIGDKKHDEVRGIVGQLKEKALVIDKPQNIPLERVKKIRSAGIVVQSTQNMDNVKRILEILRKFIPEVSFCNTICNPTRIKQEEIKNLPKENSVVIIIGSKTSANTKRLYEISHSINPRSYRVNSAGEIKKSWLKGAESVGITAGASTPESSIKEVTKKLESIHPF